MFGMDIVKERDRKTYVIKVVSPKEQNQIFSNGDKEMDARYRRAVKVAIEKAQFCEKVDTYTNADDFLQGME